MADQRAWEQFTVAVRALAEHENYVRLGIDITDGLF